MKLLSVRMLPISFNRRILLSITAGIVVAGLVGITWVFSSSAVPGGPNRRYVVTITPGMSFNQIMTSLCEGGILESDFRLQIAGRLLGVRNRLKAGRYELYGGDSSYRILKKLAEGGAMAEQVTIPEGMQARHIAGLLQRTVDLDSADFIEMVNDEKTVKKYGFSGQSLEGYLFPNTYGLPWGISAQKAISIMVEEFKRQVGDSLMAVIKDSGQPLSAVLTLASIIEGEAMIDAERPMISAVYQNRLHRGMPLQADPTIQFIISDGPRRLLKQDLRIDSPYNTYRYRGLPPGPINNPGLASIKAALHPADAPYLYFVANGDGSHTFSRTLREHNRAKRKFNEYRRQVQKEQHENGL